jgi:tetratricopeptide (TPR) repeat protein
VPPPSIDRALRLHESGDLAGAESAYRALLKSRPDDPTAQHYLGMILHQRGKSEEGLHLVRRSLAAAGAVPDFHCNLAVILRDMGRLEDAVAALCRAIRLRPRYPEALNNLGDCLRMLKKPAEARSVLEQSIEISPTPAAVDNLAMVCIDEQKWPEAKQLCEQGLKFDPKNTKAYKNLGRAFRGAGDMTASIESWQTATRIAPRDAEAWFGLGDAQRAAGKLSEALASYEKADAARPNWPELLTNYMATLIDSAQIERAIEIGRKNIRLAPKSDEAKYNLSLALLCAGQYPLGWELYESRWKCEGYVGSLPPLPQPMWDGSDPAGQTILLRAEQGCGDAIQFARYIPLLAKRGAKVVLQCQAELTDLLSTVPGLSHVVSREQDPGEFDYHLPLVSIAYRFGTTPQSIPAPIPYVEADPSRVAKWSSRFSDLQGLKCGLVWAGNPIHPNDKNRSLPTKALDDLLGAPGVTFISLQKDLAPTAGVQSIARELHDFADTAAALSELDLLITADTSVAHLAGALGLPVWTLIPFAPDWRWMLKSETTPWYPTMRLFRQPQPGDWHSVLRRVASEIVKQTNRAAA